MKKARLIGALHNKRVYRVPVVVRYNSSALCRTLAEEAFEVIAYSPADAANWVRDRVNRPETEIFAYGPHGGEIQRYIGWFSFIGNHLFEPHNQLRFKFQEVVDENTQ